jgi:hypothetical protein
VSLPQPAWNAPDAVPRALRRLAAASSVAEGNAAYTSYLYAIGNDHAGTYYPLVLQTIPFLQAILEQGPEMARRAVVEVLIDLAAAFEPEPGYETLELPRGERVSVAAELDAAIAQLANVVRAAATGPLLGDRHRAATSELLAQVERIGRDRGAAG